MYNLFYILDRPFEYYLIVNNLQQIHVIITSSSVAVIKDNHIHWWFQPGRKLFVTKETHHHQDFRSWLALSCVGCNWSWNEWPFTTVTKNLAFVVHPFDNVWMQCISYHGSIALLRCCQTRNYVSPTLSIDHLLNSLTHWCKTRGI